MSRRSTSTPARPPATSDRRPPDPDPEVRGVAKPQVGDRRSPGRQVARARSRRARGPARLPGARRLQVQVTRPGRPGRSPAGITTVPSGTSSSSRRSAMTSRRSSGSAMVPSGASSRAWSTAQRPDPRAADDIGEGQRRRPAPARPRQHAARGRQRPAAVGGVEVAASPPPVGPRRRVPRPARSCTPSPAASPHGARASSRSRSRSRSRSIGVVSQPAIVSRCASVNPRGSRARLRRRSPPRPSAAAPGALPGDDARARRLSDLDELHRPLEHLGERPGRGGEGASPVVAARPQAVEEVDAAAAPPAGIADDGALTPWLPGRSGRSSRLVPAPRRCQRTREHQRPGRADAPWPPSTCAARSRSSGRSSAPGGSPAPARIAVMRGSDSAVATPTMGAPSRTTRRTRQPDNAAASAIGESARPVAATTAISGGGSSRRRPAAALRGRAPVEADAPPRASGSAPAETSPQALDQRFTGHARRRSEAGTAHPGGRSARRARPRRDE